MVEEVLCSEGEEVEFNPGEECPVLFGEPECLNRSLIDWLTKRKEFYVPGVPYLAFGGFFRTCTLHFTEEGWDGEMASKTAIAELCNAYNLKDYLVFETCVECGTELPKMDFNDDGRCAFCWGKDKPEAEEKLAP